MSILRGVLDPWARPTPVGSQGAPHIFSTACIVSRTVWLCVWLFNMCLLRQTLSSLRKKSAFVTCLLITDMCHAARSTPYNPHCLRKWFASLRHTSWQGCIHYLLLALCGLRSQRRVASPSHYNSTSKLAGWLLPFSPSPPPLHSPSPPKQTLPWIQEGGRC